MSAFNVLETKEPAHIHCELPTALPIIDVYMFNYSLIFQKSQPFLIPRKIKSVQIII